MKITAAEYVGTAVRPDQYPPPDRPEVAVVGRSNSGKSTLINRIANRKHLAQTSGKPGKTRTVNFFLLNDSFYLVDLPGYGYAQVARQVREGFPAMLDAYLLGRPTLLAVVLLVDIRHKPTEQDVRMYQKLAGAVPQVIVACTKADKISRGRWHRHMRQIQETLCVPDSALMTAVSSLSPEGIQGVLAQIHRVLPEGTGGGA